MKVSRNQQDITILRRWETLNIVKKNDQNKIVERKDLMKMKWQECRENENQKGDGDQ